MYETLVPVNSYPASRTASRALMERVHSALEGRTISGSSLCPPWRAETEPRGGPAGGCSHRLSQRIGTLIVEVSA